MVDDLQQFEAQDAQPADWSSVSNVHVKEAEPADLLGSLQQLTDASNDQPQGMSTVSNVHVG